jgi:Protein of unknown function (DUF1631)
VTDHHLDALLQSALTHLLSGVVGAFDKASTQLGSLAIAATRNDERQTFLDAAYGLQHKHDAVRRVFAKTLSAQIAQAIAPRLGAAQANALADTDWAALRLVDEEEIERTVTAARLGKELESQCGQELRELLSYFATLQPDLPEEQHFPLRPDAVGQALFSAVAEASNDPLVQKSMSDVLSIHAGGALLQCYRALIEQCQREGIAQAPLTLKKPAHTTGGGDLGAPLRGHATQQPLGQDTSMTTDGIAPSGRLGPQRQLGQLGQLFGMAVPDALPPPPGGKTTTQGTSSDSGGNLLALMRHLQALPEAIATLESKARLSAQDHSQEEPQAPAPQTFNLIRAHRDALLQASGGTPLDQMVIDIVAALFDQLLADPDVPPQMARQIGRLQLPVLRVALRDQTFFHVRRHPVRQFINRMGSLAAQFDELDQGAGKQCIDVITALVNDIVSGDFDQISVYNDKLGALEAFIEAQRQQDRAESEAITTLLGDKEADLKAQQRYRQLVGQALRQLDVPDLLKSFLSDVWPQVIFKASTDHGADSPACQRFTRAGHRLVMSVQPQGHPSLRQAFLQALPGLMRDLHDGLAAIKWPEADQKAFFEQLLPLHAQAMKAPPAHQLTLRLLEDRLRHIERIVIPSRDDAANDPLPEPASPLIDLAMNVAMTPQQAQQAGWIAPEVLAQDSACVDIDLTLGDDPELSRAHVDILLDSPAPPAAGPSLVNFIQSGAAYRMMLKGQWRKVRLTWVSEGRSFFIFTQGHQAAKQTISLTARTLQQMCESGRFKAFEQAQLLERATIRARRQLAQLGNARKAA